MPRPSSYPTPANINITRFSHPHAPKNTTHTHIPKGNKSKRSSRALGDLDVNAPTSQAPTSSLKQVAKFSNGQTAISATADAAAAAKQQLAASKQLAATKQLAALVAARARGLVATTTGGAETAATVMAAEDKKEKERDWKSVRLLYSWIVAHAIADMLSSLSIFIIVIIIAYYLFGFTDSCVSIIFIIYFSHLHLHFYLHLFYIQYIDSKGIR